MRKIFILLAILTPCLVFAEQQGEPFTLQFPIVGHNPSTVPISALVDHSPPLGSPGGRSRDGIVKAFDGTEARVEWGCIGTVVKVGSPDYGQDVECDAKNYFRKDLLGAVGYSQENGNDIDISGVNYVGNKFLFYDDHSGNDFAVPSGSKIVATAFGRLYKAENDFVNGKGKFKTAWEQFHTFYIQHGDYVIVDGVEVFQPNGYSSWYLHGDLNQDIIAEIDANGFADVDRGQEIGTSGDFAYGKYGGVGDHLHFESRKDGISKKHVIDPYASDLWEQDGEDPVVFFQDNFDDNSIDTGLWTYREDGVSETNGELHLDAAITDKWGWVTSKRINIDPTKTFILSRKVSVYAANRYFDGGISFRFPGFDSHQFGISYADYSYTGGGECVTYGFSVYRNAANSHVCADQGVDTSELIDPIFGEWFDEEIQYNPTTGQLHYFINGELRIEYNVGVLPNGATEMEIFIHTWGWYTGHYQYVNDFILRQ